MILSLFAAAVLLAEVTPAAAQAPAEAAPAAAATAAETSERNKVVCRKVAQSGTRFTKKMCFTKAEMAERQQDDRQALEKVQQQGAKTFN